MGQQSQANMISRIGAELMLQGVKCMPLTRISASVAICFTRQSPPGHPLSALGSNQSR